MVQTPMNTNLTIRALLVDDETPRHNAFLKALAGMCELVVVDNFFAAMEVINSGRRFDIMYLDRDLGEKSVSYEPYRREYSGRDVVSLVVRLPDEQRPDFVVVHSQNVVDGPKMAADLNRNGISAVWLKFDPNNMGQYRPKQI